MDAVLDFPFADAAGTGARRLNATHAARFGGPCYACFMTEDPQKAGGAMTLNERLYFAGLIERWDAAARARDREAMLAVLQQVGIEKPDAIVEALLANPARYGF